MTNEVLDLDAFSNSQPTLSAAELEGFRKLLYDASGITLTQAKRHMVTARLAKRLRQLRIASYSDYLDFLRTPVGQAREMGEFIDVMTTNKTEFFRERAHYDVLMSIVLPEMRAQLDQGEPFSVWSAGCSTGEEPYSLGMQLYDSFYGNELAVSILATDICTRALSRAKKAVYSEDVVEPVPAHFTRRFLLKGKGSHKGFYRVAPEIRRLVQFERLNFMDETFGLDRLQHVIWCRNVMIYFDTPTKIELAKKFSRLLVPGGYLFIGHSESLNGLTDDFVPVVPAVYQKTQRGRL